MYVMYVVWFLMFCGEFSWAWTRGHDTPRRSTTSRMLRHLRASRAALTSCPCLQSLRREPTGASPAATNFSQYYYDYIRTSASNFPGPESKAASRLEQVEKSSAGSIFLVFVVVIVVCVVASLACVILFSTALLLFDVAFYSYVFCSFLWFLIWLPSLLVSFLRKIVAELHSVMTELHSAFSLNARMLLQNFQFRCSPPNGGQGRMWATSWPFESSGVFHCDCAALTRLCNGSHDDPRMDTRLRPVEENHVQSQQSHPRSHY